MSENKNIINEQEPQDDHMIEGRNAVLEAFRAGTLYICRNYPP